LQFKESVHRFAQEHIAPHAARIDASNYFPQVRYVPTAGRRGFRLLRPLVLPSASGLH
jgi:alkylation response protein AidB-like acyl-CoA dehydrogenase